MEIQQALGLFVPERHFIAANGLPATLQNTQVHPPVPNEWFEQYALPVEDADALDQDPDGDGFTNLDEWQEAPNPSTKIRDTDYLTILIEEHPRLQRAAHTAYCFKPLIRTGDETCLFLKRRRADVSGDKMPLRNEKPGAPAWIFMRGVLEMLCGMIELDSRGKAETHFLARRPFSRLRSRIWMTLPPTGD